MAWWKVSRDFNNAISQDVNPDLASERESPSFRVETLTNILDGGAAHTRLRRSVESAIHSDPLFSREKIYFMSRKERYERAIRITFYLKEKMKAMGWTSEGPESKFIYRTLGGEVALNIHNVFVKCVSTLGSDKQISTWLPLATNYNILGTYAQTELGHGTYLRGLETTATFDISTQEFVINTPKLTATKWWPGDLGKTCTHALVQAQLHVKGKDYGMHPFIVQIRSLQDHSTLPGINVGDIGPKMSFEHIDNGFLMMRNIRIPRENMLSRYSEVLPDGTYVKRGSDKINYFSMIFVRVSLLREEAIAALIKACVISIRYSAVRRQSELKPGYWRISGVLQKEDYTVDVEGVCFFKGIPECRENRFRRGEPGLCSQHNDDKQFLQSAGLLSDRDTQYSSTHSAGEVKIIDYQTQQQKLLPLLAAGYAMYFMANYVTDRYNQVYTEITTGNFASLPELHALAAGMKGLVTEHCSSGVEVCRKACGGHGYSLFSGLPSLYTKVVASCTYEGENTVLHLQAARFLVKCYAGAQSGQPLPPSTAYLASPIPSGCQASNHLDFLNPEMYLRAYQQMAYRLVASAANKLRGLVQSGAEQYVAWNRTSVELVEASMGHCRYMIVKTFVEALKTLGSEPEIQKVLKRVCDLHALHGIFTSSGDFLHDGYLSGKQMGMVTTAYLDLLALIRKDAVLLVDAFDYTDEMLLSALGTYDGNVYHHLFEWAQKDPANTQVDSVFENYLKSYLHGSQSKL